MTASTSRITAVIFDLDGVVRHFEPSAPLDLRYGLPAGTIEQTAYEPDLLDAATTGATTHEQWFVAIEQRLVERHGPQVSGAAAAFADLPATVDSAVLALSNELRNTGIVTAVLTNGTTRVESEAARLGIPEHFDRFFNSARIGYAKPDPRVFQHAVDALSLTPQQCAFTDDSAYKLSGATEIGIATHHYTGIEAVRVWLRRLGLAV